MYFKQLLHKYSCLFLRMQECIKLIKSDTDFYFVTKETFEKVFKFSINAVLSFY